MDMNLNGSLINECWTHWMRWGSVPHFSHSTPCILLWNRISSARGYESEFKPTLQTVTVLWMMQWFRSSSSLCLINFTPNQSHLPFSSPGSLALPVVCMAVWPFHLSTNQFLHWIESIVLTAQVIKRTYQGEKCRR